MVSALDFMVNLLDLFAFFLVAPSLIGEDRMAKGYYRWFGFQKYLFSVPPWSPGIPLISYAFVGLSIVVLLAIILFESISSWLQPVFYVVIGIVMLAASLTLLFSFAVHYQGFIRAIALCGVALFVLARFIAGGRAAGLWG
jgi:hypothetical protein